MRTVPLAEILAGNPSVNILTTLFKNCGGFNRTTLSPPAVQTQGNLSPVTTPQALYHLRAAPVSTPVLALQTGLPVYENVSTVYVTFSNLVLLLFVLLTLHLGEVSRLSLHLLWLQVL